MTEERIEDLERAWDESDLMDDQEYREWYEDLTQEEQALIDAWDKQYEKGVARLAAKILDAEKRAAAQPLQGAGREEVSR